MRRNVPITVTIFLIVSTLSVTTAIADGKSKGVGPVTDLKLGAISSSLALSGQKVFIGKCMSCHKFSEKYVGPALKDITKRRLPEWIMNMILNPQQMIQDDPEAKALFEELLVPMPDQHVTQDEARGLLEYFRSMDELGPDSMPALPGSATPTPAAAPGKKGKVKSPLKK